MRAFLWAVVFSLSVVLINVVTLPLPPITEEQKRAAEHVSKEEAANYTPLRRFWHWTTHDAVAFYTSVLAIFTGVLGASTIGLWIETRRGGEVARATAEAANRTADAAVAAERARVGIIIKSHAFIDVYNAAERYPNSPEMNHGIEIGIDYVITNAGKTAAIIRGVRHGLAVGADPVDPVYSSVPDHEGIILGYDEVTSLAICKNEVPVKTIGDALKLAKGETYFWFFGAIDYEDVFDRLHTKRFFLRVIRRGNNVLFQPYEYKDYNRST